MILLSTLQVHQGPASEILSALPVMLRFSLVLPLTHCVILLSCLCPAVQPKLHVTDC